MSRHIYGTGFAVGLTSLEGFMFDPNKPFAGCRICADIYQSEIDRNPVGLIQEEEARLNRKIWSQNHAKQHSDREHKLLELSGRWCTPEAAFRFAAYGIIPITDILDDETLAALRESSPVPTNDSEGS